VTSDAQERIVAMGPTGAVGRIDATVIDVSWLNVG
jgi:hypothetical protein